jgi:acetyl esterase/lipase
MLINGGFFLLYIIEPIKLQTNYKFSMSYQNKVSDRFLNLLQPISLSYPKVNRSIFMLCFSCFIFSSCSQLFVLQKKNIIYSQDKQLTLNVYSPKRKTIDPKNVLVFIHGGNWTTGNKSMYRFFGKGMAKKGVVTVIIDYRKYPFVNYPSMAMDVAQSLKWVKDNITSYGGDVSKIYVSGHSAGAHLAALIATDTSYFDSIKINNPIKGCVLIDAFGLDIYSYLKREEKYNYDVYRSIFTKDEEQWKNGSPFFHLHEGMPKFILFIGGKTYPGIIKESNAFIIELKKYQSDAQLITVPRKHHASMIFSFINPKKIAYRQILEFMKN